ncbi:hypothetical protein Tsp_13949 [Trichinella spiralis]|uniref:hypothetical protein n=1 Tax=Trichinella spiralis TaxID=6334 RepID=UPI0001EFDEBA|nr:hypothetical protein Tsp_13949 [Trichinella spiralis]
MSCINTKSGSSECTVILSVMNCCMLSGRCSGPPALNIAGAFPFVSVVFRSIHFFICFCSASRPLVEAPLLTLLYSSNGTFIHFFLCYRCRSLVSVDSGGMFSHIIQQKLRDLQVSFQLHHRQFGDGSFVITGATRMTSSAGYGCCFNDGVAGCATWLTSTIRLLQPLILCSFFTVSATHRS